MITLKKILFPTDFSESAELSLKWALLLAKNFEAELTMFHAVVLHGDDVNDDVYNRFPDLEKCFAELEEQADSRLEKVIEDEGKVFIRQVVRRGVSASEEILGYIKEEKFDLVVMGTHGRRGIKHLLLGSVAERVVQHAPCPVLTVRESGPKKGVASKTELDVKHIILPIDFSGPSKLAARYAVVLSKLMGARLEVVHVIDSTVHPSFYAIGVESIIQADPDLPARAEKAVHGFMEEAKAALEYNVIIADGKPAVEIAKKAEQMEDPLIVIASHGMGYLERLMLGSTTEKVVRMANCPVLTVKPDERDFVK